MYDRCIIFTAIFYLSSQRWLVEGHFLTCLSTKSSPSDSNNTSCDLLTVLDLIEVY